MNSLPDTIKLIELSRMRWAGHVACIGRKRIHKGFWWRNLKGGKKTGRHRYRCENNDKMNVLMNWTGGRGLDSTGTR